jgi:predicted porin
MILKGNRLPRAVLTLIVTTTLLTPVVTEAEPRVYGRIRNALVYTDRDHNNREGRAGNDWDVQSHTSRFGLKGSERLGDGLKVIYQLEWEVDTANGVNLGGPLRNRLGYAGLKSNWGTLSIGRQWTPHYIAVNKSDVWQLNGMNEQYLGPTRLGDMLLYRTPEYLGFNARLGVVMAAEDDAPNLGRDGVDIWNASVDFNNGPVSIGTSYLDYRGSGLENRELWGVGAKYRYSRFTFIAQYEYQREQVTDNAYEWSLVGEYKLNNNLLRIMYSDQEKGGSNSYNWALGVQHYFSRRTSIYAEFQNNRIHREQRLGSGLRIDF